MARVPAGRGFKYLVKWEGYGDEESGFVYKKDMATSGALRTLEEFDAREDGRRVEMIPHTPRKKKKGKEPAVQPLRKQQDQRAERFVRRNLSEAASAPA